MILPCQSLTKNMVMLPRITKKYVFSVHLPGKFFLWTPEAPYDLIVGNVIAPVTPSIP